MTGHNQQRTSTRIAVEPTDLEDRVDREVNPHWDVVLKNLAAAVTRPQSPAWEEINQALSTATNNVLAGKMGVKQALRAAAEEAQSALDAYQA